MAKKRSSRSPAAQSGGTSGYGMIPNVSLSRAARTGEAAECWALDAVLGKS
jgi:hypothetical protein